jgi:hypothetical protein
MLLIFEIACQARHYIFVYLFRESTVMNYLNESRCKCGHLYDYHRGGKSKEKYFYPPTRHGKYWVDNAKVYQMDPMEDFIKDTVRDALKSADPTVRG